MNKKLALVSGIASLVLTACASQQDRITASGSYAYLKSTERTQLQVPTELDSPEFTKDYEIPALQPGADTDLIGRNLHVVPPALVIPLVQGSHVEEGSKGATVLLDQVKDSEPLNKTIWNSLIGYLEQHNINVESFDPAQGELVTGWMSLIPVNQDEDSSWFSWSSDDEENVVGQGRYRFNVELKPHGRTAQLTASLQDYRLGDKSINDLNAMEKRRDEVMVLNQVIGHYEYLNQLETNRRIAQIRQGLNMDMGFDDDGNPAFVLDANYDIAWPRIQLVLRKLGFNVKDLDKSNGLIFVQYTDEQVSWWSDIFSSSDAQLLDYEDYRLKVTSLGPKTSITFMDKESTPFNAKQVADLFKPFEQVMTEDGLDI
ncbi:outer membrane protein assembly factor BamC [Alteromonas lipolytica]|uniref:Outer membrane protein assembly factor BamC n=1 Tax=Alteromonas lipolytica TaxID=1856405 RepID=A0A1E8FHQ9_9ALTE|nr:outer membrane protein assembly factor BamC [Alteromonas lipolytica]OFI35276.1 outer membrane assembly protein BamC [Alteromonas lipolytica]GGF58219.1 outer membrane protein assembly factor BamC [Alteromonas lipolytica]